MIAAPALGPLQPLRVALECGHVTRSNVRTVDRAGETGAGFWCADCRCHRPLSATVAHTPIPERARPRSAAGRWRIP